VESTVVGVVVSVRGTEKGVARFSELLLIRLLGGSIFEKEMEGQR
jgi:hypothetical protein